MTLRIDVTLLTRMPEGAALGHSKASAVPMAQVPAVSEMGKHHKRSPHRNWVSWVPLQKSEERKLSALRLTCCVSSFRQTLPFSMAYLPHLLSGNIKSPVYLMRGGGRGGFSWPLKQCTSILTSANRSLGSTFKSLESNTPIGTPQGRHAPPIRHRRNVDTQAQETPVWRINASQGSSFKPTIWGFGLEIPCLPLAPEGNADVEVGLPCLCQVFLAQQPNHCTA